MIGFDTDVLVRIVTNDDPAQARRAADMLRNKEIFVAKTAYFVSCQPPISRHGGHPFHLMPAADFTA